MGKDLSDKIDGAAKFDVHYEVESFHINRFAILVNDLCGIADACPSNDTA